ncbi:MAG: hypothetical protein ACR2LV_07480 [Solirubrobacteraceae bacterium]
MATQTKTGRQAAASKGAATRKRNAAKSSEAATKASARRTGDSAKATGRAAKTTARQASRSAARRFDEASSRLDTVGRQAQRALLIQIGAALEARDVVVKTAQTYTSSDRLLRELNRFEHRGAGAFKRGRRDLEHEVNSVRREAARQTSEIKANAEGFVEQVKSLA